MTSFISFGIVIDEIRKCDWPVLSSFAVLLTSFIYFGHVIDELIWFGHVIDEFLLHWACGWWVFTGLAGGFAGFI